MHQFFLQEILFQKDLQGTPLLSLVQKDLDSLFANPEKGQISNLKNKIVTEKSTYKVHQCFMYILSKVHRTNLI